MTDEIGTRPSPERVDAILRVLAELVIREQEKILHLLEEVDELRSRGGYGE